MEKLISSGDRYILLASMLASCIIWVFISLSQTYNIEVAVPVTYINLPDDKVLSKPLPEELFLYVKSKGTNLIWQFYLSGKGVQIDHSRLLNNKVNTANLVHQFSMQLSQLEIREIRPDTIYFIFEQKSEKLVPVKLQYDITTNNAFDLKLVSAAPDTILVSGPTSLIDTLTNWPSELFKYRDINQNYKGNIKLQTPALSSVTISTNAVEYEIKVEEFTEKTLLIPIERVNLPPHQTVFMYPSEATVVFQVGISEFDQIESYYFKMIADFEEVNFVSDTSVPLRLAEKPISVRNVRFSPKYAEFIIVGKPK